MSISYGAGFNAIQNGADCNIKKNSECNRYLPPPRDRPSYEETSHMVLERGRCQWDLFKGRNGQVPSGGVKQKEIDSGEVGSREREREREGHTGSKEKPP